MSMKETLRNLRKTLAFAFRKAVYSTFYSQNSLNDKFTAAAKRNDDFMMDVLKASGAKAGTEALMTAIETGEVKRVDLMLGLGADIHADHEKALRRAMERRDSVMALHLAEKGANADAAVAYARAPGGDPVARANINQWFEKGAPHLAKISRQQHATVKMAQP